MAKPTIRRAQPHEDEVLTELAMRAKASWGYDAAFMAACRAELTITPEKLAAWDVWVAEVDGTMAGMVALSLENGEAEVQEFFVEADLQGRGVGAALMAVLLEACRKRGIAVLNVDADPNAVRPERNLGGPARQVHKKRRIINRSPIGGCGGRVGEILLRQRQITT